MKHVIFFIKSSKILIWRKIHVILGKDESICFFFDLKEIIEDKIFPNEYVQKQYEIFLQQRNEKWRLESLLTAIKQHRTHLHQKLQAKNY